MTKYSMNKITRKEALNKGLKTYFTGKPCKRGHICKRYISKSNCVECHNEYAQRYRENNRTYIRNYSNQYSKQYKKNNPDMAVLNSVRRKGYLKYQTPSWYEEKLVKQLYLKRDELNKQWNTKFEVDHIIPITSKTVCGLHCWDNLQLLDQSLNGSKHNTYQQDW